MERIATSPVEAPPRKPLLRLLEFFLMRQRFAELRADGLSLEHEGFAASVLAYSLLRDAHQLASSAAGLSSALVLYRSALRLLVHDRRLKAPETASDQARSAELEAALASPALSAALDGDTGERALALLSDTERMKLLVELRSTAQRLADERLADVLRVRRLLWTRRFRLLALAAALGAGGFGLFRSLAPVNLALHRPVETSPQDPKYAVPASRVVDGDELNLGFHGAQQPDSTVTIDLGEVVKLHKIQLFNRADCCQDRAVPLSVQLSQDGRTFTSVARRTRVFYRWDVKLQSGSRARFVRVKHEATGFFHLSEIKVF